MLSLATSQRTQPAGASPPVDLERTVRELAASWREIHTSGWAAPAVILLRHQARELAVALARSGPAVVVSLAEKLDSVLSCEQGTEVIPEASRRAAEQFYNEVTRLLRVEILDCAEEECSPVQRLTTVFLVDTLGDIPADVVADLQSHNYAVQVFNNAADACNAAPWERPQAVISNVDASLDPGRRLEIMDDMTFILDYRPRFIFLTDSSDVETRIDAARHQVDAYFRKPVNQHHLSSALNSLLHGGKDERLRILLASSGPNCGLQWEERFARQGFEVRHVTKPDALVGELAGFRPELILIEAVAPDEECFNLVRLVRLDETYFNTPVVILTDDSDASLHVRALQAGADDFIARADDPDQLVSGITRRVRRFRRLVNMILFDPLTGTISREAFLDRVPSELATIKRNGGSACLAMIDLDKFKSINDTHGHLAGDAALRQVSGALKQRLRRSDVVGRYAGDEFIVLLPSTTLENGYKVLDGIRESLGSSPVQIEGKDINVTLSIGVVGVDQTTELSVNGLIARADALLYQAKRSGRNAVVHQ